MNIPPILKNKWVLIGGGFVIILALVLSSSGKSSTAAVSGGPSDAQVAAQTQLALAQLSEQGQQDQVNGQIALATAQGNIDLAKAGLDAQVSQYAIDAQNAINALNINQSAAVQLAGIDAQNSQTQAGIQSQTEIAKWTLDEAAATQESQQNFQLQYATQANQTQVMIQQMQANLVNNQIMANKDVTLAGFNSQEDMANINANLQLGVTQSNNSTQSAIYAGMTAAQVQQAQIAATQAVQTAQIQAGVQKNQSNNGLLGGLLGGIFSLFSDPLLKKNVAKIGEEPDGLGVYSYHYLWDNDNEPRRVGVMADEVARLRPHALGPVVMGFRTVNYHRL